MLENLLEQTSVSIARRSLCHFKVSDFSESKRNSKRGGLRGYSMLILTCDRSYTIRNQDYGEMR